MLPVNNELNHMRRNIQAGAEFVMYAITSPDRKQDYVKEAQTCLEALDGIESNLNSSVQQGATEQTSAIEELAATIH